MKLNVIASRTTEDVSTTAAAAYYSGDSDSLFHIVREYACRPALIESLQFTRPGPVHTAGGVEGYLRLGGLPDNQIPQYKGVYGEFVRGAHESGSVHSNSSTDPMVDRYVHHTSIQDYTGNSVSEFVHGKLEADSGASRFQVTDHFYEKILDYLNLDSNGVPQSHGKFVSVLLERLPNIHPDSRYMGFSTSSDTYEQDAAGSRDKVVHPVQSGLGDIAVSALPTILLYSAMIVVIDAFQEGQVTGETLRKIVHGMPEMTFRAAVVSTSTFAGLEFIAHHLTQTIIERFSEEIVGGLVMGTSAIYTVSKYALGYMNADQMRSQLLTSAVATSAAVAAKWAVGSIVAGAKSGAATGSAGGPVGTAVGVAVGVSIGTGMAIFKIRRLKKFQFDKMGTYIEHERNTLLGAT